MEELVIPAIARFCSGYICEPKVLAPAAFSSMSLARPEFRARMGTVVRSMFQFSPSPFAVHPTTWRIACRKIVCLENIRDHGQRLAFRHGTPGAGWHAFLD